MKEEWIKSGWRNSNRCNCELNPSAGHDNNTGILKWKGKKLLKIEFPYFFLSASTIFHFFQFLFPSRMEKKKVEAEKEGKNPASFFLNNNMDMCLNNNTSQQIAICLKSVEYLNHFFKCFAVIDCSRGIRRGRRPHLIQVAGKGEQRDPSACSYLRCGF